MMMHCAYGCTEDGKELTVMDQLMDVITTTRQEYAWGPAIQFTARGSEGLEIKCTIFAKKDKRYVILKNLMRAPTTPTTRD